MVDQGEIHYLLRMLRKLKVLTISQTSYLQKVVERFGMKDSKPVATPLEFGKKFHKRSVDEEQCDEPISRLLVALHIHLQALDQT